MNGLQVVTSRPRAAEAHSGQGGPAGAPADADAAAAFDSVFRDVGQRKGEVRAGDAPQDETITLPDGDAEGKPAEGRDETADATPAPLPAAADAALLLAELTGVRVAAAPTDRGAAGEGGADGKAGATVATREQPAEPPPVLKATVVARETHFEPVKRPAALDRMAVESGTTENADESAPAEDAAEAAGPASTATRQGVSATTVAAAAPAPAAAAAPAPRGTPARTPAEADGTPTAEVAETAAAAEPRAVAAQGGETAGDRRNDERPDGSTASSKVAATAGAEPQAAEVAVADTPDSLPAPTLQRLAGTLLTEARALASTAASASATPDQPQQSGGPVKILTIRLQPDHLGTVTVRMRLVGNTLEMQFRVSNAETAELLKRDRHTLSELLKTSGYEADLLTIQTSGADGIRAVATADASTPAGPRQDWQQPDGFRQGGQPAGRQDQGRQGQDGQAPRATTERHDETLADGSRAGDIYV